MRALHVISGLDPENGGPTSALIGLAEAQAAVGLDVSVIATWQRTSGFANAERLRGRGIKVTLIGQAYGKLSKHPELRDHVSQAIAQANVVHIHALWEQIQYEAMHSAAQQRVPFVVTPHGMLSRWSFTKNRWAKTAYFQLCVRPGLKRAAMIHYTADVERELASRFSLKTPTIIEPCGIDLAEFEHLSEAGVFRQRFPQLANHPVLLFLGRLSPQKGIDLLIRAFASFTEQDTSDTILVIAGPDQDAYQQQLKTLIDAQPNVSRLQKRVLFTGMLAGRERIEALRDATLFVLPSRHENFGIVVAESLACGTPVLLSRGVNIWREIESAGVGGAVEPDAVSIAAGLRRWMTDAPLRSSAAARTQDFARQRYDWRSIAARWAVHYRSLASPSPALSAREGSGS